MIRHFTGLLIFSGSIASLAHGISLFLWGQGKDQKRIISVIFIMTFFLFFEHYYSSHYLTGFNSRDNEFVIPVLALCKALKYFIGPLLLMLYARMSIPGQEKKIKPFISHILPGIAGELFVIASIIGIYLQQWRTEELIPLYDIQEHIGRVHLLVYTGYIIISILLYYKDFSGKLKSEINRILIIAFTTFTGMALVFSFIINNWKVLESSGMLVLTALIYGMIFDKRLGFNLLEEASKEIKRIRYSRSLLSGIDTSILSERLSELMNEEKLFCDEDLSLQSLAAHLEISHHQLSEYLNTHLHKNFNRFINDFRIEEAKLLLKTQKERSVLHIAFSAGFNSKSVFYREFTASTGISPVEYRKRC